MRAAYNERYGPPEDLRIIEVAQPIPNDYELLIQVHASGVNRTDCGFLRAKPFVTRLFSGLLKPKRPIKGCEFSGKVVKLGDKVSRFKIGDKVFGFDDINWGGHGEYKVIHEAKSLTLMPTNIDYLQAGSCVEGAHYALNYVRALQRIGANNVLVHGATGAIGSSAVQLLKQAGMRVVATSTTKNMKLIKSLGPDKVIDWQKQDFTKSSEKFDAVFDAVGKSSFKACKPLLKNRGVYISTELGTYGQNPLLALMFPIYKVFGAKRVLFPIPKNNKEIIEFLRDRIAEGSFKPVLDKTYPLDRIIDAYIYVESGQKTGNVVIKLT
jgi:NADPH:quinone reductase-like Zn-dependent oxidoreductase